MTNQYHYRDEFIYVRISELPKEQQEEFTKFMAYQTRPLIYDEESKVYLEDAVYIWDYDRWLAGDKTWD